jgi:hypothetical protein
MNVKVLSNCPVLIHKKEFSFRSVFLHKKIFNLSIIILILILALSSISFGQISPRYYWRIIPSYVTADLNAMNQYVIVGDNGTILRKINDFSYALVTGIPNVVLNGVCTLNNLSTIVGNNGTLYYCSNNAFTEWYPQSSSIISNLNGITIAWTNSPALTRIAVGDGGIIIISTSTSPLINWTPWTQISSSTVQKLNSVALDTAVSIAVGDNGILLRSTNKGNNWTAINSSFLFNLNSVYFTPTYGRRYWITGNNGLILESTNGGLNWTQVPSGTTADLKAFTPFYICGSNGIVLKSLDSGSTWTQMPQGVLTSLNSISIPGIISSGDAGKILRWDMDSSYYFRKLEGNSISSFIVNSGIFNQNINSYINPGFEWPKGTGRYAVFTTGISMSAMVQGQLRQAMASYNGEMIPGRCNNGVPFTNDTFKVYSVKKSDNPAINTDWLRWGLMVPYGAPYVDVNINGIYEPLIDTPGMKNASQTVFVCMTDGFTSSHNLGEGFGGGTLPLFNEVHLTAWCYSQPSYADMQFLKYEVVNKGNSPWTRTYFSFIADPDLGDYNDDYIGCDTVRKLGFCFNYDNMDGSGNPPSYGAAPPAVGFILLKSAYRKYVNPGLLGMTGFNYYYNRESPPPCESSANGEPISAYYFMMGLKKDSSYWVDPTQTPRKRTRYVYAGDPETNTGWTEYKGSFMNCNNDTLGYLLSVNPPGDRMLMMHSGSEDLTVMPGDTQKIVMCQLIARGTSNLNSVTKLKQLSDVAINFYNTNFTIGVNKLSTEIPSSYSLSQNYPNPFNPVTKIRFDISHGFPTGTFGNDRVVLKVFDIAGRELQTLVNEVLQPGRYEVTFDGSGFASGVYFYQIVAGSFVETRRMVLVK